MDNTHPDWQRLVNEVMDLFADPDLEESDRIAKIEAYPPEVVQYVTSLIF